MNETAEPFYPELEGNAEANKMLFELDGRNASGKLTKIYLEHPEKTSEMPKGHAKLIVDFLNSRSELGEDVDIKLTADESDLLEKAREKLAAHGKVRGLLRLVFPRKSNR